MPTYTCTTTAGRLSEEQRLKVVESITATHSEETGAPRYFTPGLPNSPATICRLKTLLTGTCTRFPLRSCRLAKLPRSAIGYLSSGCKRFIVIFHRAVVCA